MPFFVAVQQYVSPERIDRHLVEVRKSLVASPSAHPRRRHIRLFQALHNPCRLLIVGEWRDQADYERFTESPGFRALSTPTSPPAQIDVLSRLRLLTRPALRPVIFACAIVSGPDADHLAELAVSQTRQDLDPQGGIVSVEVFRIEGERGRFLTVHGWRSFADLRRFRDTAAAPIDTGLAAVGASIERFVGTMVSDVVLDDAAPPVSPREQFPPPLLRPVNGRDNAGDRVAD